MVVMRLVLGLLLLAGLVCLGLAITTREPRWRRVGIVIIRWTVIAGLAAFGMLVIERLLLFL
jgi:hypothetical protein